MVKHPGRRSMFWLWMVALAVLASTLACGPLISFLEELQGQGSTPPVPLIEPTIAPPAEATDTPVAPPAGMGTPQGRGDEKPEPGVPGGNEPGTGQTTITLVNQGVATVCYVRISPVTSDQWGEDWLGETEVIGAGAERVFTVTPGRYDLQAEDCGNNPLSTEMGVDVSGAYTWIVTGPELPPNAGEPVNVTVVNNGSVPVYYIYISPVTSDQWGEDWLGTSILEPGASRTFTVEAGLWDMRADDQDHNVLSLRWNVTISGDMTWTIPD